MEEPIEDDMIGLGDGALVGCCWVSYGRLLVDHRVTDSEGSILIL